MVDGVESERGAVTAGGRGYYLKVSYCLFQDKCGRDYHLMESRGLGLFCFNVILMERFMLSYVNMVKV